MGPQLYQIWSGEKTRKFQKLLLDWYRRHRRELPWRSDPTPYRVWIAEVMLQQTQVRTVLPFYQRFLERFPDVQTLADASEEEVLALWAGLGYYNRARNLHRAARLIVREFDGSLPRSFNEIRKLPGIGRYTAGALCSIAFNRPHPIVDGNVRRVVSRLHGIEDRAPEGFFWEQATLFIPEGRASDFNQALMELGALVCLPSRPLCLTCPVRPLCDAHAGGAEGRIPAARLAKASQNVELVVLVLQHRGNILLSDRNAAEFIPGRWSVPTEVLTGGNSPRSASRIFVRKILGNLIHLRESLQVRHSITFRRILAHVFHADLNGADPTPAAGKGFHWIELANADRYLTSSLYRKAIQTTKSAKTPKKLV